MHVLVSTRISTMFSAVITEVELVRGVLQEGLSTQHSRCMSALEGAWLRQISNVSVALR